MEKELKVQIADAELEELIISVMKDIFEKSQYQMSNEMMQHVYNLTCEAIGVQPTQYYKHNKSILDVGPKIL